MNKDIMKEIIENIMENADELKSKEVLNEPVAMPPFFVVLYSLKLNCV